MKNAIAKQQNLPKETNEFLTSFVNTGAQGIESFRDGGQISDLANFFDEAISWGPAIEGLGDGFPKEARAVSPTQIEAMFAPQQERLVQAGLNPMLAGAITTNMKGIYYTYCAIVQSGQSLVIEA